MTDDGNITVSGSLVSECYELVQKYEPEIAYHVLRSCNNIIFLSRCKTMAREAAACVDDHLCEMPCELKDLVVHEKVKRELREAARLGFKKVPFED